MSPELIGSTSLSIVKEWIDSPTQVSQTIRFDSPGRRVFLRSPSSIDIRTLTRDPSETPRDRSPSPRHRQDSSTRTVFIMGTDHVVAMVAITDRENRSLVRWAIIRTLFSLLLLAALRLSELCDFQLGRKGRRWLPSRPKYLNSWGTKPSPW